MKLKLAQDDSKKGGSIVVGYLERCKGASRQLTLPAGDGTNETTAVAAAAAGKESKKPGSGLDPTAYIQAIADNLLLANDPLIISQATDHLPPLVAARPNGASDDSVDESDEEEDDDDENDHDGNKRIIDNDNDNDNDNDHESSNIFRDCNGNATTAMQYRNQSNGTNRADYMRQLLRVMAPIAMDVSAAIASQLMATKSSVDSAAFSAQAVQFFVLYSQWLPIAPHLSPMFTELLMAAQCSKNQHIKVRPNEVQQSQCDTTISMIVAQASYQLSSFYNNRRDVATLQKIWDWSHIFTILLTNVSNSAKIRVDDDAMDVDTESQEHTAQRANTSTSTMLLWYATRTIANLMDWSPVKKMEYLKRFNVQHDMVPWNLHPWIVDQEEAAMQAMSLKGRVELWDGDEFVLPSAQLVRSLVPKHTLLVTVGNNFDFFRRGAIEKSSRVAVASDMRGPSSAHLASQIADHPSNGRMVHTTTTIRNLTLIGGSLCAQPYPRPVLVCGRTGSGKSSLVKELNRLCQSDAPLLEIHVDEETDSKTLVGSYTTTDIPGEFSWRPGALTRAARSGQWVLLEDIDAVPVEIQAALVKLFEERLVPIGNGKYERCHPNFRLFGTCTTTEVHHGSGSNGENVRSLRIGSHRSGGKRILNPTLWQNVHIDPLPISELKHVAKALFPNLPDSVTQACMSVMTAFDGGQEKQKQKQDDKESSDDGDDGEVQEHLQESDRHESNEHHRQYQHHSFNASNLRIGRQPTIRDLFKLLSRISHGMTFEEKATYTTESQRIQCLAESVDVFLGSCPDKDVRQQFVAGCAAPVWQITGDAAMRHVETRQPDTQISEDYVKIGRSILTTRIADQFTSNQSESFSQTNHSLRLMESIGICIRENEPTLLVGETGCGKTTLIQELAKSCGREMVVQNLSLQTDSTDLLGGYKPLEIGNIADRTYRDFVDIFVATFSRKQNSQFLDYAASMKQKKKWKRLSQCFLKAVKLGLAKVKSLTNPNAANENAAQSLSVERWAQFQQEAETFERQRVACDTGLAFAFSEGALVDAIKKGKWVLLDEINLASSETLQRLCGLLDDSAGSITLTERGDAQAIRRDPDFRLFAAMNPATDAGKKDLQASIRSRFTEIYVHDLLDPIELRTVVATYLSSVLPANEKPPEHRDIVILVTDLYLRCRELAEDCLVDGSGHKPRYTLRTLSRALKAAKAMVLEQRLPLRRVLYEGFQLAFEGCLNDASTKAVRKIIKALIKNVCSKTDLEQPGRRPGGRQGASSYTLLKPFWIKTGPVEPSDWAGVSASGRARFILTDSAQTNLRRLACAIASGPWPVLLEGPTSAGKTTLVEYIAARCGHQVVRINNHEHTDVQEYTGSFSADSRGLLSFRDGILVKALRRGHWVILDELNLAPSEVLEALNRLLDDNRELYLAETNETVKPHPNFRLFATQNPSGVYGGRKPLSRAFRNRFVELYLGDIPSNEMILILEKRCGCPPSHAKRLVEVMDKLRYRRSKSSLFLGKDSLITPRDLLRWASRETTTKLELVHEGYMLLAERLRTDEEKGLVQEVLEEVFKTKMDMDEFYYGKQSASRELLHDWMNSNVHQRPASSNFVASIAPTRSLLRLISLVSRCVKQKEPVLLVGETGCGKTTVVQFLSYVYQQQLLAVNCHATTETSDLLGSLRPVRGRNQLARRAMHKLRYLLSTLSQHDLTSDVEISPKLKQWLSYNRHEEPELGTEDMEIDHSDGHDDAVVDVNAVSDAGGAKNPQALAEIVLGPLELQNIQAILKNALKLPNPDNDESKGLQETRRKRRKLATGPQSSSESDASVEMTENVLPSIERVCDEVQDLISRYSSLFEWSDGPLVQAMKAGHMMLLDEMSLAEDAVLERLNSVLEPSRTLVLAEKGDDHRTTDDGVDDRIIHAHDSFRIFATMNPGGDFGKRELSPALRSRFTEIWVPSISHRSDIEIVLRQTINPCIRHIPGSGDVLPCMLEYIEWFNVTVCGELASTLSGLKLSLRDMLSWARFIAEATSKNQNITLWSAYRHGACLMHLDGLGLGAGLGLQEADKARKLALDFINGQTPAKHRSPPNERVHRFQLSGENSFGSHPFFIRTGTESIPESSFNLHAPTTAQNAFRVLRGMQVRKPILLEGSPGVGKTSLVTALAAASGHKLVRINLSEQTDISDLMGNDLPVQDVESSGASFRWCDGVLLTAIKEGSWILLDELNLASQSVLEGLNSCLDHRATVYIPELGTTYDCPSTFRIFAAQNPLAQGGGRKGLPKSFLNRFTKVYVDALDLHDLKSIVTGRYPQIEIDLVNKLITFNGMVNQAVAEDRSFGDAGSPWEFNLRDVFRLCDLLVKTGTNVNDIVRDLYHQRFRTGSDRQHIAQLYSKVFGTKLEAAKPVAIVPTHSTVKVGNVVLERLLPCDSNTHTPMSQDRHIPTSLLQPIEAIARCISLQWPCLVVGSSDHDNSSMISALAELCCVGIMEHCLSPSSDVTELIGCFEQVDKLESEKQLVNDVIELTACVLHESGNASLDTGTDPALSGRAWTLYLSMSEARQRIADDGESVLLTRMKDCLAAIEKLVESLTQGAPTSHSSSFAVLRNSLIPRVENGIQCIKEAKQRAHSSESGGHFVWRDGVLVQAMREGRWLHLENANLCPSSVLDRLNSVLEKNGELLLSECGTQNETSGETSYQIIRPHPNFRIFLSMNPSNGEISRAMRNRCVEVAVVYPHDDQHTGGGGQQLHRTTKKFDENTVELLNAQWRNGARLNTLAAYLDASFSIEHSKAASSGGKAPSMENLGAAADLFSNFLRRGLGTTEVSRQVLNLSLELDDTASAALVNELKESAMISLQDDPIPTDASIRSSWSLSASEARIRWESRVIRLFLRLNPWDSSVPGSEHSQQLTLVHQCAKMLDGGRHGTAPSSELIRNLLIELYVSRTDGTDFHQRVAFLGALPVCRLVRSAVRAMSKSIEEQRSITANAIAPAPSGSSSETETAAGTAMDALVSTRSNQVAQELVEKEWESRISDNNRDNKDGAVPSVLEVSYLLHCGKSKRSDVSCAVTAILYPLLKEIDSTIDGIFNAWNGHIDPASSYQDKTGLMKDMLKERDKLWGCVRHAEFVSEGYGFLAFDEAEFLVQWKWFKRSLVPVKLALQADVNFGKLTAFVETVDMGLFGTSDPQQEKYAVRKKMAKPLPPQSREAATVLQRIRAVARSYSITQGDHHFLGAERRGHDANLVKRLIDELHPVLFVKNKDKLDLLMALCTAHWASANEIQQNKETWRGSVFLSSKSAAALEQSLSENRQKFAAKIEARRIDTQIATVENQMSLEKLESLRAAPDSGLGNSWRDVPSQILQVIASLQIVPVAEVWCILQERRILTECQRIFVRQDWAALSGVVAETRHYVDVVISSTSWDVKELRCYQTLLWALEGDDAPNVEIFHALLRCLLPAMVCCHWNHCWVNTFSDLESRCIELEIPFVWNDKPSAPPTRQWIDSRQDETSTIRGPHQVDQMVRTEAILGMLGDHFLHSNRHHTNRLFSLENIEARQIQSKKLLSMLSTLTTPAPCDDMYGILYHLHDAMNALQHHLDESSFQRLIELARNPALLTSLSQADVRQMASNCSLPLFTSMLDTLFMPIVACIRILYSKVAQSREKRQALALANIHLGLLRLQFLVPESPLDPGRAPLAKVSILNRSTERNVAKQTAIRLESGFIDGCFNPQTAALAELCDEEAKLRAKAASQTKKIIERPDDAPPFYDFFREVRDVATGFASISSVQSLLELIQSFDDATPTESRCQARTRNAREETWQTTANAICDRLQKHFSAYEDISLPIVESIRRIQTGLRDMQMMNVEPSNDGPMNAQCYFLKFPSGYHDRSMRNDSGTLFSSLRQILETNQRDEGFCARQSLMAALTHLLCERRLFGHDASFTKACSVIFETAVAAHLNGVSASDLEGLGEAADEDMLFEEVFPNHYKEFTEVLDVADDGMDSDGDDGDRDGDRSDEEDDEGNKSIHLRFDQPQLSMLAMLHRDIYSTVNQSSLSHQTRMSTFWTSYGAASAIEQEHRCAGTVSNDEEVLSCHAMALAVTLKTNREIFDHENAHGKTYEEWVDFHNDPWPQESMSAAPPIEGLIARISQLLSAFPGNAILLSLGKLCERVLKYDLVTTPIGKMMTGLEVVLRQAQDWEQHASDRVRLGEPLQKVAHIVARWRKVELKSWSRLLEGRERRVKMKARRYWARLYSVLMLQSKVHSAPASASESTMDMDMDGSRKATVTQVNPDDHDTQVIQSINVPTWVVGDSTSTVASLMESFDDGSANAAELTELVKLIDTFVLTSSLGQIEERLTMLEGFVNQTRVENMYGQEHKSWRLKQHRALQCIVSYYRQFLPFLLEKLDVLRQPIETKLKDEVKLAKWDEQSYYSLVDSTERNHQKLMKILTLYDEVLSLNVGLLLQQESCSGLRSRVEAYDEMCTTMPSNAIFFPNREGKVVTKSMALQSGRNSKRKWTDSAMARTVVGHKHALNMQKYAKKMRRILRNRKQIAALTCCVDAANVATDICDAIFSRIDALRNKSTRPMKERALVDLFRELKQHGFKSTTWGIPSEVRNLVELGQLPSPAPTSDMNQTTRGILGQSEAYFQRCLSESKDFHSETTALGSKYMTRREMDIMINLCDHMFLMMCQQRTVIAHSIEARDSLSHAAQSLSDDDGEIMMEQKRLMSLIRQVRVELTSAKETLNQLILLLTSTKPQLANANHQEWVRDVLVKMHSILEMQYLDEEAVAVTSHTLISDRLFETIQNMQRQLQDAKRILTDCYEQCTTRACLPTDAFEVCKAAFEKAQRTAAQCNCMPKPSSVRHAQNNSGLNERFTTSLQQAIEYSLLSFQAVHSHSASGDQMDTMSGDDSKNPSAAPTVAAGNESEQSLWDYHDRANKYWSSSKISRLSNAIKDTMRELGALYDMQSMPKAQLEVCASLGRDLTAVASLVVDMSDLHLEKYIQFYYAMGKLNYVLLRVFRVLVAKGYCSDESKEDNDVDADGDVTGMTFEDDNDGTGMGEGDGKKDVTDQIEDEEQLLGLKDDIDKNTDENQQKQDPKQLDEEEAEKGMEMEGDFDGEMFDVPENQKEENDQTNDDDDDEEELDREMGDDVSPNEEVVDEKMWDDSDDEEDGKQDEDEKFEKDSALKGETVEGETRTKEEDEKDASQEKEGEDKPQAHDDDGGKGNENNHDDDGDGDSGNDEEDKVNNDYEDNYEDQHGVDVRDTDGDDGMDDDEGDQNAENDNENEKDGELDLDDNLHLDGDDADGAEEENLDDDSNGDDGESPDDAAVEMIDQDEAGAKGGDEDEEDGGNDDDEGAEHAAKPLGAGVANVDDNDENEEETKEGDEDEEDSAPIDIPNQNRAPAESHGVKAADGQDAVMDDGEEDEGNENDIDKDDQKAAADKEIMDTGADNANQADASQDDANGNGGYSQSQGATNDGNDNDQDKNRSEVPNPFKNPGDANEYWHKRLNVVQSDQNEQMDDSGRDQGDDANDLDEQDDVNMNDVPNGEFEYTENKEENSTQVLGEVAEEQAVQIPRPPDQDDGNGDDETEDAENAKQDEDAQPRAEDSTTRQRTRKGDQNENTDQADEEKKHDQDDEMNGDEDIIIDDGDKELKDGDDDDDDANAGDSNATNESDGGDINERNKIVSDMSRLSVEKDAFATKTEMVVDDHFVGSSAEEMTEARTRWLAIQSDTFSLSRRLCEKLRLVMEPLVASKLRGDYRTGKRINMKRVIGYIASGYRKDKIWLRRTKPAKRNYRVLVAVDDSESMLKSGAGDMALRAMATLAVGMNQLEIGELGVASFGNEMKLIHPFHLPFTSESGVEAVRNFKFDQQRTRTSLCVEGAINALDMPGENASMQLVFLISDGRIERDSRVELKRLVREMLERNILLAMIIVEGNDENGKQKKDNILNMKEVSFVKGKPVVKRFIEDYPFPYYMVLDDMAALPEVLGDALKQWYEMITHLHSGASSA